MAHYKSRIAYDGTQFSGFQKQANARTVQGSIEEALKAIGWQGSSILAAGRTDAGVHATGQVISFDLDWVHSAADLVSALNANLPEDIAAWSIMEVYPGFHPRYDALQRTYQYHIYFSPARDPLRDRYAWRVWPACDLSKLRETSQLIIGEHDFSAFGSPWKPGGNTIRNVYESDWVQRSGGSTYQITANAYLYHMIRRLVKYQVWVVQGKISPKSFLASLNGSSEEITLGLAPPNGLFLTGVFYQIDPEDNLGE